jgi:hypothetical protein
VSGIVSKLEMDGDRERIDEGVLGDDEDAELIGYIASLTKCDGGLGALGDATRLFG